MGVTEVKSSDWLDFKWFGWADNDNNSHALKPNGKTVCGVEITGLTELVYDSITACPECRQIIHRSNDIASLETKETTTNEK